MGQFPDVDPRLDLPALDRRVLALWRDRKGFERSLEQRAGAERIGFWIDTEQAYWTMDSAYVQSVWWALAELHRHGLLFEDYKVVPYCPRCGTGLSDAELGLDAYDEVEDLSAYVALPATSGRL